MCYNLTYAPGYTNRTATVKEKILHYDRLPKQYFRQSVVSPPHLNVITTRKTFLQIPTLKITVLFRINSNVQLLLKSSLLKMLKISTYLNICFVFLQCTCFIFSYISLYGTIASQDNNALLFVSYFRFSIYRKQIRRKVNLLTISLNLNKLFKSKLVNHIFSYDLDKLYNLRKSDQFSYF